ncbi:basic helix-loop-helix ARNT-like protein 1 isoform X2 [Ornithodoros turicata]|uniref:basic helix-loop-helix ARNT-like protein 1 isoform X2 n=1 Tax=Ornithodoros turicata TaxID=34597 RepID=UPI0031397B0F
MAEDSKKQNHSEIEKRRRDKMNLYIGEMASLVPMCKAMSRKLDKLTVLRMAVQHIRAMRGSINSYTEGRYKPPWLRDEDLKEILLQAADGFLFVVSCDRGRILFVSESVQETLHYSQSDLLGHSWFDILHPKDISQVKEQLSSSEPKERLIDAKTLQPLKGDFPATQSRLCPGARRSFFCRIRTKNAVKTEEADTTTGAQRRRKSHSSDRRYSVVHCTGYLKTKCSLDNENHQLSCLVAVGRVHGPLCTEPLQFVSRHALDGKFLFVDKKATLLLGYLPQELMGTACYDYYSQEDVELLSECHKAAVTQTSEAVCTEPYRFRTKAGSFACLQSCWRAFKNPWTKEVECLVAVNTLLLSPEVAVADSSNETKRMLTRDLSKAASEESESPEAELMASLVQQRDIGGTDGNDEAAMAVIMSLLEADAGLGGPVDFSGMPWPLP